MAGRPKGSNKNKEKVVQEVKEVETKEMSFKERRQAERSKEVQRKNEIYKKINECSRDLTIEVRSNVDNFVYQCPNTKIVYKIERFNGTEMLTYDTFRTMCNRHKKILERKWIVPQNVFGNSDITIEDIMDVLKINKYFDEDILDEDNIDDILLNCSAKEVAEYLRESDDYYKELIIERAISLAKEDQFNNNSKRLVLIKENKDLEEVFKEIDEKLLEEV